MTRHPRSSRQIFTRTGTARVALGVSALLMASPLVATLPASASASAPSAPVARVATFINLGTAATYSVLAGAGVSNTGAATVLVGDLGLSPTGVIAGFPPGTTMGTIHDKDAAAETAQEDTTAAYDDAVAQPSTTAFAGDQAGATFKPGVHTSAAAVTNTGTITLDADGDSSAVFVFQIGGALSSAAASKVVVTDGALANNVYWQVVGAVSLGAGAKFVGTFLSKGAVSFGEGASLKGRALTPSTVALANSPVTEPKDDLTAPEVTIDGGPTASTNDTTPAISGTTDEPAGRPVTVTVSGQTLTTTVGEGGLWSVGAATLAEGPHDVLATISDASQNVGTATQVLTVDVTAPGVSIDGGETRATKDTTPAISGTTDEADASVTVEVAGQTLTSPVGVGGTWTVTAAVLTESTHAVVATVEDAAGNTGTASQILEVDVTKPVVGIDGGATRKTKDTSPWTYGTTGEQAGSTVTVTVAGQTLTTDVTSDGTWGVSAQTMSEGIYKVVASITDAAGNTGRATQELTVGDVPVEPAGRYQPDGAIRRGAGDYVGRGTYGSSADQRLTARLTRKSRSAKFQVLLTNDGNRTDTLKLRGTAKSRKFKVTYRTGGENVTGGVVAGTYRTGRLTSGESVLLVIKVTMTRAARVDDRRVFNLRSISTSNSTKRDTVAAVARR